MKLTPSCPKIRTEPESSNPRGVFKILAETNQRSTGSVIGAPEQTSHSSSHCQPNLDTSHPKRHGATVVIPFVFLDTTGFLI